MNEKVFHCSAGSSENRVVSTVILNGVEASEKLTPALARRASRVAFGHSNGVDVVSNEDHGYALYANTHRKFSVYQD